MRDPTSKRFLLLGTSAAIQVPSFHCRCATCNAARLDPSRKRTRASAALLGAETILIDAGPDMETQLERESLRCIDRIFISHWHFDHVAGLGALGEPPRLAGWKPIDIYLPGNLRKHFDDELSYVKRSFNIHPISPGDTVETPDAVWEIVKTAHTDDSVGFIVRAGRTLAYLADGIVPPPATAAKLQEKIDVLVLEATMDELDAKNWLNFSARQAAEFWKTTGAGTCVLSHASRHSWKDGRICAGWSDGQTAAFLAGYPGLTFAFDGMEIPI